MLLILFRILNTLVSVSFKKIHLITPRKKRDYQKNCMFLQVNLFLKKVQIPGFSVSWFSMFVKVGVVIVEFELQDLRLFVLF